MALGRHMRAASGALVIWMASCTAVAAETATRLQICYGLGCAQKAWVDLHDSEVEALRRLMTGAPDAAAERERIARAVALLEQMAGRQTPAHLDRARNPGDEPLPSVAATGWPPLPMRSRHASVEGQLDCIDESSNTTAYLEWMVARGWLKWHRVREWAFRAPDLFGQHWSAQIEELGSGRCYAVDSWPQPNGEPPQVLPFEVWRRGEPNPRGR